MPAPITRGKRRLMGDINVVPYIDVMLVLLIIFMVTAPLLTEGVKVNLPKAGAEPIDQGGVKQEPLVLSIDARGRLYMNVGATPKQPIDDETTYIRAAAALRRNPGRTVYVQADRAVNYGRVMQAMVLLQRAGAQKVGFLTDPLPPNASATPADALQPKPSGP
jgi:biopolymer transport protein TolR